MPGMQPEAAALFMDLLYGADEQLETRADETTEVAP